MNDSIVRVATRHPVVVSIIAVIAVEIVAHAVMAGDVRRALLYLVTVAIGVGLIEMALAWRPVSQGAIPVRSVSLEVGVAAVSYVIAALWLWARLVRNMQPAAGPVRLVWIVFGLGTVFNAVLALFLLARRYWPSDLGVRFTGLAAVALVMALFASIALTLGRSHITWSAIVAEMGGSVVQVVLTALSAGVPEEFFRFVWQTRLGALLNNRATAWLVASVLWASLHFPIDYTQSHSLLNAASGVIDIIPLGLLWGYLTHRTRSFLPSMLLHATNIWGLQNLN